MTLNSATAYYFSEKMREHHGLARLFENYALIDTTNHAAFEYRNGKKVDDVNDLVGTAVQNLGDWIHDSAQPVAGFLNNNPEAKTAFLEALAAIREAAKNVGLKAGIEFLDDIIPRQVELGLRLD